MAVNRLMGLPIPDTQCENPPRSFLTSLAVIGPPRSDTKRYAPFRPVAPQLPQSPKLKPPGMSRGLAVLEALPRGVVAHLGATFDGARVRVCFTPSHNPS
jgi:hypothetical protein